MEITTSLITARFTQYPADEQHKGIRGHGVYLLGLHQVKDDSIVRVFILSHSMNGRDFDTNVHPESFEIYYPSIHDFIAKWENITSHGFAKDVFTLSKLLKQFLENPDLD